VPEPASAATEGVAVITGASRGLGRALAEQFASHGTRVVGVGRSVLDPSPAGFTYVVGDIRERATVDRVVAAVGDDAVDVLINNAAVGGRERELNPAAMEEIRAAIEVNALGHAGLLIALGTALARSSGPLVVNVTSRMGSLPFTRTIPPEMRPASLAYAMSKATLDMLTLRLGRSAFGGAHVVGLDPGPMRTAMGRPEAERSPERVARLIVDSLPAMRAAPAGEIVDLASLEVDQ
jgi:NAD(P)-dependent dehydrogenase (short-subunit alcohol dehydrogenase family)